MIEIKFCKRRLAGWEKIKYARVFKEVIKQVSLFNKEVRLLKDIRVELRIIFK